MAFIRQVSDLKTSVAGLLSGLDLSNVDALYKAFERAARVLVQKAKIPETQGTQNLTIYSGVTDYLIDQRIYGTSLLDIKPQGISRNSQDFVYKKFADDFDRTKQFHRLGTMATFTYSNGTPIIRLVSSYTPQQIVLDTMSSITGWNALSPITGLTTDNSFYYQSPASLRFNIAGGPPTAFLSKTISSPINLTSYLGVGMAFMAIEVPSAIATYELRLGSDSSNYYTVTSTTGTLGNVTGQFMLIPFDFSTATTVGSPDITKIQYIGINLGYGGGAMTNVRLGGLFISLPVPVQIVYGSAGFFLVGTTVSQTIATDNDYIILADPAYSIYEYECALAILQQTGGGASDATMASFNNILNGMRARNGIVVELGLYDLYRGENPNAELRTSGSWYSNDLGSGGGYPSNY